MKDELTVLLIESVNQNAKIDSALKIELVSGILRDCKEKKIGKIIVEAIEKRGRGRPRKMTPNQENMIKIARENRTL